MGKRLAFIPNRRIWTIHRIVGVMENVLPLVLFICISLHIQPKVWVVFSYSQYRQSRAFWLDKKLYRLTLFFYMPSLLILIFHFWAWWYICVYVNKINQVFYCNFICDTSEFDSELRKIVSSLPLERSREILSTWDSVKPMILNFSIYRKIH